MSINAEEFDDETRRHLDEMLNKIAETVSQHGIAWLDEAACSGLDTQLFFLEQAKPIPDLQVSLACMRCPVRMQCLEAAKTREDAMNARPKGTFGGVPAGTRIRSIYPYPKDEWIERSTEIIADNIEKYLIRESGFDRRETWERSIANEQNG